MLPGKTRCYRAGGSTVALALLCALTPVPSTRAAGDPSPRVAPAPTAGKGAFVPGEAIVRFKPSSSTKARQKARNAAGVDFADTLGLPQTQVVSVDRSVTAAVRRLENQPGVAYAQPNYRYKAVALTEDTFSEELWGLDDPAMPNPGVSVAGAWEGNRGDEQVIAILDTGVDLTHPDLVGNLWENNDPVDEDLHGFDFVDDDGDPDDYNFHGTHVAGTAAAIADNNAGIAGVAPEAEIMAVRVLDGDGTGSTAGIAAGIGYAADHGANVINMSLSAPAGSGDKAMADAVEAAGTDSNVVVVVAAGNHGADVAAEPESPCVLPQSNLICVAALNQKGTLASFSNYGAQSVDLAAPGTGTLSTKPDYGAALYSDDFETEPGPWVTQVANGGVPWERTSSIAIGTKSATDSPDGVYGQAIDPEDPAISYLLTDDPIDLESERGCRIHFRTRYEIEPFFDEFIAGGYSDGPFAPEEHFDTRAFEGALSGPFGGFAREDASISNLDGRNDVHPVFGVLSDFEVEFDGAYVDAVRLVCRAETYNDEIATESKYDPGNYIEFQGTSMATPHVAGVVALVRTAAPELDANELVDAVLDGASAIPNFAPGKRTATEGIADACKAVALVTGGDVATECPASSEPTPQPSGPNTKEVEEQIINANPPSPTGTPPPPDTSAPTTFLRQRPAKVLRTTGRSAKATFKFDSTESGVTFLCKFDRKAFRLCLRRTVRAFPLGPHVLRVKARDAAGNTDPTPAVYRFQVKQIESG